MAGLSKRNLLYNKVSDSLSRRHVKALRATLVKDGHLGAAKVEKATPHEMFNMLEADAKLPVGDLSLLSSFLRARKKFDLVEEVENLAREERESLGGRGTKRGSNTTGSSKRTKGGYYATDGGSSRDGRHQSTQQPARGSAGHTGGRQTGRSGTATASTASSKKGA
ncbi:PREDICTED: uncharacterized protein LOC109467284 [Branchiostoma belcheri]|uniref:Uncharacterized protein LOC109467284 n=1 Tax=Branchiostoma belcheri TaxID=7741 RepID=A0A6P4YQ48_BRABE|nr:PREDICTED: uncharacterized protein LOC109467284 [Branchiostoma belcheri]